MKRATEASLPSTLPGAVYLSCVKEACLPAPGEEAVRTPSVFHQLHRKVPLLASSLVAQWWVVLFSHCPVGLCLLVQPSVVVVVVRGGMTGSPSPPIHVLPSPSPLPSPPHLSSPLLQLSFMTMLC